MPGGAEFLLEGVAVFAQTPLASPPTGVLKVEASAGTTVLADCTVDASNAQGARALKVQGATVFAARCRFYGGNGYDFFLHDQSHGVAVDLGRFAAVDCDLRGGSCNFFDGSGAEAGSGLWLRDAEATLHDTPCIGGTSSSRRVTSGSGVSANGQSNARIAGSPPMAVLAGTGIGGSVAPAILCAAGSTVTVHGNIQVPTTSGAVTFDVPLPRLRLAVTPRPNGEVPFASSFGLTLDAPLPNAHFFLAADLHPQYSTGFPPLTLGELLLPVASFQLFGTLDAAGHFGLAFAAGTAPVQDVPVFVQAGVADFVGSRIRMSNFEERVWAQ